MVKRPSNHFTGAELSGSEINRVALYARVSTLNNQDPEMQLAELREYAARRGWQIIEEFTDQGVSGCKESRPEPMCGKFFLLSRRQGSLWGGLPTPTGRGGSSFIDRLIVSITSIFPHCTKRNLRCFNYQKGKAKPPQEFGYCHRQRLERTGSTRPPTENHPGQKNKRHSRPRGSLARA